jgi:subtilisin family serine protease
MGRLKRVTFLAAVLVASLGASVDARAAAPAQQVEVVVALDAPALAGAVRGSRVLTPAARSRRLSLRSPHSIGYLETVARQQRALERRLTAAVPTARVRWRYSVVLNALAVVVPANAVGRLERLPGVREVYGSVRYRPRLDRSTRQIEAHTLWGPDFSGAGNGVKIGIIDDGIDASHPFFSASGFTAPAGFPKGDTRFTNAKVIVARAFPPPRPGWRNANLPFDSVHSEHGTHVAGIAAGNGARVDGRSLSGVAPRAYLGNYKVLTVPTASDVGLDGNSPEIAAGIEAAVRDGMDVINLSLGEPEIEPSRDLVVAALNAAAAAGVVPVVAAGNDFGEFGRGSVGSPGSTERAITVAATVNGSSEVASFSSSGPTPLSLRLKPEVSAPGQGIASSVPGGWDIFSGTSMAAPHVAGAVALLRQRNPGWTAEQVKSALVTTGRPVVVDDRSVEASTTRQGGGLVTLTRALRPLVFTSPTTVSFGFLRPSATAARTVDVSDAGGGAGPWTVSVEPQRADPRITVTTAPAFVVPGRLSLTATAAAGAPDVEQTGFVVLSREGERRRIPYWLHVDQPALSRHRTTRLRRTGTYRGSTAGRPSLVSSYRYPDDPGGAGVRVRFDGPEQVFRVRITRPVANFGVVVLSRGRGVRVEPRVVFAGDENRQVGYTSLPLQLNPYLRTFLDRIPVSGAVRPAPGAYDIVFDSPSRATSGRYRFRFWIGDTTGPTLRLLTRTVARGAYVRIRARDAGSGVDPTSIVAFVDGNRVPATYSRGVVRVSTSELAPGRRRVLVQVSDYQETRNQENVPQILPNTRRLSATVVVR